MLCLITILRYNGFSNSRSKCFIFLETGGDIKLKTYEPTVEGLIQSWVDRFPTSAPLENLLKLWEKDVKHFYYLNIRHMYCKIAFNKGFYFLINL